MVQQPFNGYYEDLIVFKQLNNPADISDDIYDSEWVTASFMRNINDLDEVDAINRYWSVVENKFTDTSLGGNISINTYPQFTRYADIRIKGRLANRNDVTINNLTGNLGMGRYYGEKIDDNSFDVYFTFGVPEFNSMFNFLLSAVDYKKTIIVSKGRNPIAYDIGKLWGRLAIFVAFPVITGFVMTASFLKNLLIGPGRFSYYYLKENMITYWSTVNSLVTLFATELGLLSPIFMEDKRKQQVIGTPLKLDQDDVDFIKKYVPNLIINGNYIDVFAMVTKAQRIANRQIEKEMQLYETGVLNEKTFIGLVKNNLYEIHDVPDTTFGKLVDKLKRLVDIYGKENETNTSNTTTDETAQYEKITQEADGTYKLPERDVDKDSFVSQLFSNFKAIADEGARFAVFRVENPGNSSENFRNEVGEIPLESGLKAISNKIKSIEFSMSGGNVGFNIDDVVGAVKDTIHGVLDGVTFGLSNVLSILEGGANLDLPLRWVDSDVTFPSVSYKMKLIAPYGNPISQLQNIYIPLAAILAATLPRSTGPSSYGSPFLCSMFLRGQRNIELGMITNLTITRGTANLPFNKQKRPLAIDVNFTVKDFSKIIAVPTVSDIFDPGNVAINEDSPLIKYLSTLAGRNIYDALYMGNKTRLRLSRIFTGVNKFLSPAFWGMRMGDGIYNVPIINTFTTQATVDTKETY